MSPARSKSLTWAAGYAALFALGFVLTGALRRPPAGGPASPAEVAPGSSALALVSQDPARALTLATACLRRRPDDAEAHEALARLHVGRAAELAGLYAGLAAEPGLAPVHGLALARALQRRGSWQAVAAALVPVLERAPGLGEARALRGVALLELGDHQQAATELLRLRGRPDRLTQRNLGTALLRCGEPAEALPYLRAGAEGGGDHGATLDLARGLLACRRPEEARPLLQALADDPLGPPQAEVELARLDLARLDLAAVRADREGLEQVLRRAERAASRGAGCYDVLARAYQALGEPELAVAAATAGLEDEALEPSARQACQAVLDAQGKGS